MENWKISESFLRIVADFRNQYSVSVSWVFEVIHKKTNKQFFSTRTQFEEVGMRWIDVKSKKFNFELNQSIISESLKNLNSQFKHISYFMIHNWWN